MYSYTTSGGEPVQACHYCFSLPIFVVFLFRHWFCCSDVCHFDDFFSLFIGASHLVLIILPKTGTQWKESSSYLTLLVIFRVSYHRTYLLSSALYVQLCYALKGAHRCP